MPAPDTHTQPRRTLQQHAFLWSLASGSEGQLGHPQLHALHMMQANAQLIVDTPRKLESLDPFRLQPWKRWVRRARTSLCRFELPIYVPVCSHARIVPAACTTHDQAPNSTSNSTFSIVRVTAISSGKHHCMAVTVCGELVGFGRNKVCGVHISLHKLRGCIPSSCMLVINCGCQIASQLVWPPVSSTTAVRRAGPRPQEHMLGANLCPHDLDVRVEPLLPHIPGGATDAPDALRLLEWRLGHWLSSENPASLMPLPTARCTLSVSLFLSLHAHAMCPSAPQTPIAHALGPTSGGLRRQPHSGTGHVPRQADPLRLR